MDLYLNRIELNKKLSIGEIFGIAHVASECIQIYIHK